MKFFIVNILAQNVIKIFFLLNNSLCTSDFIEQVTSLSISDLEKPCTLYCKDLGEINERLPVGLLPCDQGLKCAIFTVFDKDGLGVMPNDRKLFKIYNQFKILGKIAEKLCLLIGLDFFIDLNQLCEEDVLRKTPSPDQQVKVEVNPKK